MKNRLMRKTARIIFTAAVLSGALLLQGTAALAEEETPSGEFTMWSCFTGDSATWEEERVQKFMEENPDIKINLQFVPDGAGVSNGKLLSAIAGGTAPDLIVCDNYTACYQYVVENAFEPMEDALEKVGITTDYFFPAFKNLMVTDDHTYLIPTDCTVILLYYRKSMAEAAGLDINNPPKTIEELDQWAEAMTIPEGESFKTIGFIPWLESGGEAFIWPTFWGNDFYDEETRQLNLVDNKMVALYEWMQSYSKKYDPSRINSFVSGFGGMFSPDHPFMTGKVAMVMTGNWFTEAIHEYAPDIEEDYEVTAVPVPADMSDRYGSTVLNTNVWAIPSGHGDKADLIAQYIKFALRPEVNEDNFWVWRALPTNEEAIPGVQHYIDKDPIYLKEVEYATNSYSDISGLCPIASELGERMKQVRDDLIYNPEKDVKAALQELQDSAQAQLDEK